LEAYYVRVLQKEKVWTFDWYTFSKKKSTAIKSVSFNIDKVVIFYGLIPSKPTDHEIKNVNILFVPSASNYPNEDLFVWWANRQLLFCVQITVEKLDGHMDRSWLWDDLSGGKEAGWKAAVRNRGGCQAKIWADLLAIPPNKVMPSSKVPGLIDAWVGATDTCNKSREGLIILPFESTKKTFPLVAQLKLN
jgi:hypothetical protein